MKKAVAFVVALFVVGTLSAALVSTGDGLADGVADPNWSIVSSPLGGGSPWQPVVYDFAPTFPLNGTWVANDADSKWIGPSTIDIGAALNGAPGGDYYYEASFFIDTIADAALWQIIGKMAADQSVTDVLVNNISSGVNAPANAFGSMVDFSLTSGFKVGTNTVTFIVNNLAGGGPNGGSFSGFRADIAASHPIPEPGTYALVGFGLIGLALVRRRRRA